MDKIRVKNRILVYCYAAVLVYGQLKIRYTGILIRTAKELALVLLKARFPSYVVMSWGIIMTCC